MPLCFCQDIDESPAASQITKMKKKPLPLPSLTEVDDELNREAALNEVLEKEADLLMLVGSVLA